MGEENQYQYEANFAAENLEKRSQRQATTLIIVTSLAVIGYFIHLANWDKYHLAIIPLKLEQSVGAAKAGDLKHVADICIERKKYQCAIDALSQLAGVSPNATDEFRLAELLRKTGSTQYAALTYQNAIKLAKTVKPLDTKLLSDSYYGLARSYQQLGQLAAATQNYELALNTKPEVIQVTVAEAYVQLLRLMGKNDIAEALIKKIKDEGGSLPTRTSASI